jgi:hypothetical protein
VLYAAIGATAAVVLAEAGPALLGAYDQADRPPVTASPWRFGC